MLILTRKIGESIKIGNDIKVMVVNIEGGQVRIGIDAPRNVIVHREEIYEKIVSENKMAAKSEKLDLQKIAMNWKDKKSP